MPLEFIVNITQAVAWPAVIFVIFSITFYSFRKEIKKFLSSVKWVKFNSSVGSVEAGQQLSVSEKPDIPTDKSNDNSSDLKKTGDNESKDSPATADKSQDNSTDLEKSKDNEIERWRNAATLWEFHYLNLFLAPNSKYLLWEIYRKSSQILTKELFISTYKLPIPNTGSDQRTELTNIFNALLYYGLLYQGGPYFAVSAKGVEFLKFLKFIQ